jgi:uncharacterized BrkB/YihY/UPF0761 family membrane protein
MWRSSVRPPRSKQARMSLAWFAIVAVAGFVLFLCIHFGELAQQAALERLSTHPSQSIGRRN